MGFMTPTVLPPFQTAPARDPDTVLPPVREERQEGGWHVFPLDGLLELAYRDGARPRTRRRPRPPGARPPRRRRQPPPPSPVRARAEGRPRPGAPRRHRPHDRELPRLS